VIRRKKGRGQRVKVFPLGEYNSIALRMSHSCNIPAIAVVDISQPRLTTVITRSLPCELRIIRQMSFTSFSQPQPSLDLNTPYASTYTPPISISEPISFPPHEDQEEKVSSEKNAYSTLTAPLWSPVDPLETVPLTAGLYPYGSHTPTPTSTFSFNTPQLFNSDSVLLASGGPTGFEGWTYDVSINGLQMPQAPSNSAVYPNTAPVCAHTTLSPLSTGFSTGDPLPTTSLHRPPSIRGWSFGTDRRRRSSTLVNPGSATADLPATPHTAYSNTYPYPSPRSSASSHSYHPSSAIRHPSAPSLGYPGRNSGVKRVVHPSPAYTTVLDLSSQVAGGYPATELVGLPAEPKQTRFKPTKEQLDILISAYEENM